MTTSIIYNYSVFKKISKFVIPIVFSILCISGGVIYYYCQVTFQASEQDQIGEIIKSVVNNINDAFIKLNRTADNYNNFVRNFDIYDKSQRRTINEAMSKATLLNNSSLKAVWIDYDENAFDYSDAQYHNNKYYRKTGRFYACWYRESDELNYSQVPFLKLDSLGLINSLEYDFNCLSRVPKKNITSMSEVHIYGEDSTNPTLVVTISSPIFDNADNVIGVTGIDIDLNKYTEVINDIKSPITNKINLISNTGQYYLHNNPALLGKSFSNNSRFRNLNTDSILKEVNAGNICNTYLNRKNIDLNEIIYFIPITISEISSDNNFIIELSLLENVVATDQSSFDTMFMFSFAIAISIILTIMVIIALAVDNILENTLIASYKKYINSNL